MITLTQWYPLFGLPAVWLIWKLTFSSVAFMTPRRRWLSCFLRTFIYLLLLLALCEPSLRWEQNREFTFWLADLSRSTGAESVNQLEKLYDAKTRNQGIIAFAGKPLPVSDLEELQNLSPASLEDESTDLARALHFANASFPEGFAKQIVLLTDGLETEGSILAALASNDHEKLRIHTVPVRGPEHPEVVVRSVRAPKTVREREPIRIIAEIDSNRQGNAELSFFRNGTKLSSSKVELSVGTNRFETTEIARDERFSEYSAEITMQEDTEAANNRASTVVLLQGKSGVLLLTNEAEQSRFLAEALTKQGIGVDVLPSTGLPNKIEQLQNYDLVIFDNIPSSAFTPQQGELIALFVRDFGGGFLMLGGDHSFGLGGYFEGPIERILPVQSNFQREKENPALALCLVVDRSGSMIGEKLEMAKAAAKAAVELLGPQDFTGVVGFDNEAFWLAEMQPSTNAPKITTGISQLESGGGTKIVAGIELAYEQLRRSSAKIKHMIVLTDGVSTQGPFEELAGKLAAEKITVSTVALGSSADQELLQKIAERGNGRYYYAENSSSIPQIFAKETMTASKSALRETPFRAQRVGNPDFLQGIDFTTSPLLRGYVMTKQKPTSELSLATERADPLLVTWRYGLGQTGAFTSDASNRWAADWLPWKEYGSFWAQTVRKLCRSQVFNEPSVQFLRESGGFRMLVDLPEEESENQPIARATVKVTAPGDRQSEITLERVAPGRLEGFFPAPDEGIYHTNLMLREDSPPHYSSVTWGYPQEFALAEPNKDLLATIAHTTGGVFNPGKKQLAELPARKAVAKRGMWAALVIIALLLFVADVGVRRWPEENQG